MPSKDGVRGDDRGHVHESAASEGLPSNRQPSSLDRGKLAEIRVDRVSGHYAPTEGKTDRNICRMNGFRGRVESFLT
jgi:hypothetical protein